MPPGADGELAPFVAHAARLGPLREIQQRMDGCRAISELMAVASAEAVRACGFERGIVLSVVEGRLTPNAMDPIEHPASDDLRRRCQARPIAIVPGSAEAELVRSAGHGRRARTPAGSALASALGLGEMALAAVVPEADAVALVVLDRSSPPVTEDDQATVELFAHMLGLTVARLIMRIRMRELAAEVRHLTTSAVALMREAHEAPIALTTDLGLGPVFATAGQRTSLSSELSDLLTAREREIAALVAQGLSNREIGTALHLAPDTVKVAVARIVRKLGAANRVEAAARYMELLCSARGG